jgi:hypothetical protein
MQLNMSRLTAQAADSLAQPAWPQINQLCLTGHLAGVQDVEWPTGYKDSNEGTENYRIVQRRYQHVFSGLQVNTIQG